MIHSAKVANLCHSNGIKSGNKSVLFQNGTKRRWTIRAKYRFFRSNKSYTFHLFHPLAELNKRIFKSANRFVVNVVYILKDCKCTYFP